jgi:hypothetical protein
MAPKRAREDFIGFILEAEKDKELTKQFLDIKTAKRLNSFFTEQGFTKIKEDDCKDIMKSKTKKASKVLAPGKLGKGGFSPCPPNTHY